MNKLDNQEWLYQEYVVKDKGMKPIAEACGCTVGRVSRRLKQAGIKIKGFADGRRNIPKGEKHVHWRGGFFITKEGYIKVVPPQNHPSKSRYVFLHRLIVERRLGRYLKPGETVHHRDENKQNNADYNLKLCSSQSEHAKIGLIKTRKYKKLWNKEWLRKEYIEKERTLASIANEIGCKEGTVRNALNRLAIGRRRYTLSKEAIRCRIKGGIAKKPRM